MSPSGGGRSSGRSGLTLVEVLIALAIASLITMALGQALRSTRASEAAVNRTLDPLQVLDLAAELLHEELSLAANLLWPLPAHIEGLPDGADAMAFVTPGLVIDDGPAGGSVRVRYVDDRLAAGPLARDVTFEAGVDAAGEPQLYRRAGTSSRQPLVAGIESLGVVSVVQGGALLEPGAVEAGSPVSAVVLRLVAPEATRDVVIELPDRPVIGFGP
jgi:prepilin-type N-terminal cleavage/methylation domain-containing protein